MKKYYMLLLIALIGVIANAQTSWDGTAISWTNGDGTSANPYLIENGQHLAYLSEQVRGGNTFEGSYFKLTTDLDMGMSSELKFSPIGFYDEYVNPDQETGGMLDESKYFMGNFNGNFKKIDNIYIYYVDEYSVGGTGLFACLKETAVVENLGIGENSKIEGGGSTGAIIGYMNGGLVQDCYNEGLVIGGDMLVGGIVGGANGGKVLNCYNLGTIQGPTSIGGIMGFADKKVTIANCYNRGFVNGTGFYIGGIVGSLYAGDIKNCYNAGALPDDFTVCAVVGSTDKDPFTVANCYFDTEKSVVSDGIDVTGDHVDVKGLSTADMTAAAFVLKLNADQDPAEWVADTDLNEGYPVLAWQISGAGTGFHSNVGNISCRVYAAGKSIYLISDKECRLIVTDLVGKTLVDRMVSNNASVDMSDSGIYVVTVDVDGQKYTDKVIIR